MNNHKKEFLIGIKDGIPISLGYFAVAFTIGIIAKKAGLSAFQAMLGSLLNNASAGEYAGFSLIAVGASYLEVALITLITNARYLLMSCALSQKIAPDTPMYQRLLLGYDVTDELFGISIAREGYLDPFYSYGAYFIAMPGWALGTFLGVIAGEIFPVFVVSALSVSLYGMFIAVFIPPIKRNKKISIAVILSFISSLLFYYVDFISSGTKTIILTILIASLMAIIFPVKEEEQDEK